MELTLIIDWEYWQNATTMMLTIGCCVVAFLSILVIPKLRDENRLLAVAIVTVFLIAMAFVKFHLDNKVNENHNKQETILRNDLAVAVAKMDAQKEVNSSLVEQNKDIQKGATKIQSGEQDVLSQNILLIDKVNQYQGELLEKSNRIDYLQKAVSLAKRGMIKTIDFDGTISSGRNGDGSISRSISVGTEKAFYPKFSEVEKTRNWKKLLDVCEEGIALSPEWMTPYYFKAIALFNLNRKEEAGQCLKIVEENTYGNLGYTNLLYKLYGQIGDTIKMKQLQRDFNSY